MGDGDHETTFVKSDVTLGLPAVSLLAEAMVCRSGRSVAHWFSDSRADSIPCKPAPQAPISGLLLPERHI